MVAISRSSSIDEIDDDCDNSQQQSESPLTGRRTSPAAPNASIRRSPRRRGMYILAGVSIVVAATCQALRAERVPFEGMLNWGGDPGERSERGSVAKFKQQKGRNAKQPIPVTSIVPDQLMGEMYQSSDFVNDRGVVPTFWNNGKDKNRSNFHSTTSSAESKQASKMANAYEITPEVNHDGIPSWGPCYPPLLPSQQLDWQREIVKASDLLPAHEYRRNRVAVEAGIDGMCRPGFIIIGAGKCGTSSLYHYLVGHPRVVPAFSKQIHYFVYFAQRPMSWYYSQFPTTTNFLASGALMTGEASPGYLPYPKVARLMRRSLPDPKILVVGRNPLERSWSSYKYNYVSPTIEEMKKGRVQNIQKHQREDYYKKFLFTFEELIRAELAQLKACLDPRHGFGANATRDLWGDKIWVKAEVENRLAGDRPLIDLDEVCYGGKVNSTVLRPQWSQLQMDQPNKVMLEKNIHLKQSLLGRSLYTFPLEWWYVVYEQEDIRFICTEELSDLSGDPLNEVAMDFLGLPFFNFSSAIAEGAYNVGAHRGYDKATSWTEVDGENKNGKESDVTASTDNNRAGNSTIVTDGSEIPLSNELLQELKEFLQPINERLFHLVGKRCDW